MNDKDRESDLGKGSLRTPCMTTEDEVQETEILTGPDAMGLTNEQLEELTADAQDPVKKRPTATEVALTTSILESIKDSVRGMVEQIMQEQRNDDGRLQKGGQAYPKEVAEDDGPRETGSDTSMRKVSDEGNHEHEERQEREKQRRDSQAGRNTVPASSWWVNPTGTIQMPVVPVMMNQGNELRFDGQTERSYRDFMVRFREYTERNTMKPEEKLGILMAACEDGRVKSHLRRYLEVYPDVGTAYQEALRYLETSFGYSGTPAEVVWARMREGRRIYEEDIRGLDRLQVQLMEVWSGLIREAKNDSDTENRLIRDARGRLPMDMSCEFGFMSQATENSTGRPCGAPELIRFITEQIGSIRARDVQARAGTSHGSSGEDRGNGAGVGHGKTRGREAGSEVCQLCHGGHSLKVCQGFARVGSKARLEIAAQFRVCFGCLKTGHRVATCYEKRPCERCRSNFHATILHNEDDQRSVWRTNGQDNRRDQQPSSRGGDVRRDREREDYEQRKRRRSEQQVDVQAEKRIKTTSNAGLSRE